MACQATATGSSRANRGAVSHVATTMRRWRQHPIRFNQTPRSGRAQRYANHFAPAQVSHVRLPSLSATRSPMGAF